MTSEYRTTIGLEIHAELKTNTKMFCSCKNDPFAGDANAHICSVCTAQPGSLPAVNKEAVKQVLRVGAAINGTLADFTEFDRKNYFYPDIPKAYQISQYKYPLISGGNLAGVDITRVHLEEDTATSEHFTDYSLVDFNRAGVPLMELVTEPVIHDAETAMNFAKELQLLLRTLGASEANLEKGEMRIEANISVSKTEVFGTKVEVKNLNSFRIVGQAIDYEVKRHIEALERGEKIIQETRGWDETKQATFSQRTKESANDYRYFPDPDIPKYKLSEVPEFSLDTIQATLPELPWIKRARYLELGLTAETVESFLQSPSIDALFEGALEVNTNKDFIKLASNYISSDIAGLIKNSTEGSIDNISAQEFARTISLALEAKLSSRGVKDILGYMYKEGGTADGLAEKYNLIQSSNEGEIKALVEKIIAENAAQVEKYKAGDEKVLQFFVGQGMKASGGKANPQMLTELLKKML